MKNVTYTVTAQDTPSSIAQKFGISVEELFNYNRLGRNTVLFPGMIIIIPPRPPKPRPPQVPPTPPQNRIYVVRRGDTIFSIARRFRVSVESIMAVNGMRFPIVFPGQRLIIPQGIVAF